MLSGSRRLALRREAFGELSHDDLATVAGAARALPTSPVVHCLGISEEASCLDCVTRVCAQGVAP